MEQEEGRRLYEGAGLSMAKLMVDLLKIKTDVSIFAEIRIDSLKVTNSIAGGFLLAPPW